MRVYFDASIIIAALLSPKGGSSELLKFVKKGIIKGITSQTVIEEILEEDKPEKLKRSIYCKKRTFNKEEHYGKRNRIV